jgi:hypothetical protein
MSRSLVGAAMRRTPEVGDVAAWTAAQGLLLRDYGI